MVEQNEIGNAFKDRLKTLNKSPDKKVWENITVALEQKKKKQRLIPLWYRISGAIAVLLFLFWIGKGVYNTDKNTKTPIVIKEQNNSQKNTKQQLVEPNKKEDLDNFIPNNTNRATAKNKTTIEYRQTEKKIDVKFKKAKKIELKNKRLELATQNKNPLKQKTNAVIKGEFKTDKQIVLENSKKDSLKIKDKQTAKNQLQEQKNNQQEIVTNKTNKQDDINTKLREKPTELQQNTQHKNKWELAINTAPIFYNSITQESSLSPTLLQDNPQNEITMSYGVKASYALNNKWKLRTGVSTIKLISNTEHATSDAILNSNVFQEINMHVYEEEIETPIEGLVGTEITTDFKIIQNMSYYEIPVEVQYNILNKKLNINIISGISSLFLRDNTISIENTSPIDESGFYRQEQSATHLNNLSFSANIGLGLGYCFTKNMSFNVEPIAKFQFNTYSDKNIKYKPYLFGVYGGIAYKF